MGHECLFHISIVPLLDSICIFLLVPGPWQEPNQVYQMLYANRVSFNRWVIIKEYRLCHCDERPKFTGLRI